MILRPALVCRHLLQAMDASDGRRRRRKRDTTPDALGLELKRRMLELTVAGDPDPGELESWLLQLTERTDQTNPGAALAMARAILEEWSLAQRSPGFREWLAAGAPSEDR